MAGILSYDKPRDSPFVFAIHVFWFSIGPLIADSFGIIFQKAIKLVSTRERERDCLVFARSLAVLKRSAKERLLHSRISKHPLNYHDISQFYIIIIGQHVYSIGNLMLSHKMLGQRLTNASGWSAWKEPRENLKENFQWEPQKELSIQHSLVMRLALIVERRIPFY